MLEFVTESLKRCKHTYLLKPQHQPHPHLLPTYGARVQYATNVESSPLLGKEGKRFIQEVTVNFLYYARAVDCTMLTALVSIATQKANPTKNTMKKVKLFLDYATTNPDVIVTFLASNMILAVHSNASCISETKGHSRSGGDFSCPTTQQTQPTMGLSSQLHR